MEPHLHCSPSGESCCLARSRHRPDGGCRRRRRAARRRSHRRPRYNPLTLFLTFLKIGAIVYGSGYVLLPFLRDDFVTHLHWISNQQLIDAVAVGQFTPGPVFTTATLSAT